MRNPNEVSNEEISNEQRDGWEGFFNNPETIIVSAEEYEWLCQQLEAPESDASPRDLPRLRELLQEKPIWQETD